MTDQGQTMTEKELNELRFMSLIQMLAHNAMISMGKVANPETGKEELDLEQARAAIDMLAMLEEKTRNNLSTREKGHLDLQLTNLRLTFIEELKGSGGKTSAHSHDHGSCDHDHDHDHDHGHAQHPEAGSAAKEAPSNPAESDPGGFKDRRSSRE